MLLEEEDSFGAEDEVFDASGIERQGAERGRLDRVSLAWHSTL
jgi:hypothetical protein